MADPVVGMPPVDTPADIEDRFKKAWRLAAEGPENAAVNAVPNGQRNIVIVTPGRMMLVRPCPRPGSMDATAVQAIEKIAPPRKPSNIAVIAYTQLDAVMRTMSRAIPFLGYVLGLSYIGHNVIVFEGHPSALKAACREADMLIVDEAMASHLQKDWMSVALGVMRGSDLLIFGRNGSIKRVVRKPAG